MGKRISYKQQADVFRLLEEVCSTDVDGFAVYKEGWSDRAVAKEVGGVSYSAVAHRRQELHGKLRTGPAAYGSPLVTRVEEVEKHVSSLDKSLIEIMERLFRLEDQSRGQ